MHKNYYKTLMITTIRGQSSCYNHGIMSFEILQLCFKMFSHYVLPEVVAEAPGLLQRQAEHLVLLDVVV